MDTLDRVVGSLVGLACGDAVGTTSEFKERGSFPEVRGMVGGGVNRLKPGQWTDDTSLALCLAQSFIERSGHDPRDQLARYLKWHEQGKLSSTGTGFGIGNTTFSSLGRFRASNQTRTFCGSTHPTNAGNGSLMRLAPAPMLLRRHPALAVTVAGETSRTTHASQTTVDSCRYFAGLLVGAMDGASKEKLLAKGGFVPNGLPDDFWSAMQPPLHPEVAEVVLDASHAEREPPGEEEMSARQGTIHNDGYVVRTLEAALWAFGRSTGFEEGCLLVANLGDDSDTVAAVFGQLAGAFYGLSGIPPEWRDKIALEGLIESMAEELFDMSNRVDPCPLPVPPPPPPSPATPAQPNTETTPASACSATANASPSNPPPEDQQVTRFNVCRGGGVDVGNAEEDVGGGKGEGRGGRAVGAYWRGGVAAHYQQLEDGYMVIKGKIDAYLYDSMETFEEDFRAMLGQQHMPDSTTTATATDAGGASKATKPDGVSSSSEEAATEETVGGDGDTARKRKEKLTAEFVARVARDRVMVERGIRAGLPALYRRP